MRAALGGAGVIGAIELVYVLCYAVLVPWAIDFRMPAAALWRWGIHMAVVALVFLSWRLVHHAARDRAAAAERIAAEADAMHAALAAAELATLEMQVEPHFLFNTLAHVRRELRHAPAQAVQMLGALIDYLERSGPALRRNDWTLADELDLVDTYLCLIRHRFGERLRVSMDVPVALRGTRLPALAIATLVENAIQHGLAPKAGGGTLQIAAAPEAAAPEGVCITVTDDGVGLRQSQGLGLGLATVRARLRATFGAQASLTLEAPDAAAGGGVRAAIRIAAPAHA
jgi:LytS/YehU family sensor histidine kinase